MNADTKPRYQMEKEGDYYFVRDTTTNERLPYKSRDREFVERVLQHLLTDYNAYVRSRASMR